MSTESLSARTFPVSGPRAETTSQQIKNYILLNRLRPGDLMPTEPELCTALGVSRSSVREAMRTLAALDIIEVRHGLGTFVGQLTLAPLVEGLVFRGVLSPGDDLAALREVVEVRAALDNALAEQLVKRLEGTENPDLDALIDQMERLSAQNESFSAADRDFHAGLASRLGNQLVEQLVTAFWEVQTAVLPRLGVTTPAEIDRTIEAHRQMLRAAEAGDVDAYRAAVQEHYGPITDSIRSAAGRAETVRLQE